MKIRVSSSQALHLSLPPPFAQSINFLFLPLLASFSISALVWGLLIYLLMVSLTIFFQKTSLTQYSQALGGKIHYCYKSCHELINYLLSLKKFD